VIDLYRGLITPEQARATAIATGDAEIRRSQGCEAGFFIGEYELVRGNNSAARPLLQEAVTLCRHDHDESLGASAELKRLP
jgi:hypothetical protein